MTRLSDYERGMLLSSMTPGSCAMMLGRSQRWVERMRAAMAAEAVPVPAPVAAAPPSVQATPGRRTPDAGRRTPERPACVIRVKPSVVRWSRIFIAAGWTVRETAHLFDLETADLKAALR